MKRLIAAAALTLAVSLAAPAGAADQTIHLRGTITNVDHDTISLSTATGPATVLLSPTTKVAYVVKSDLSAITPGMAVGSYAVTGADGMLRAREVHIFPAGSTPNVGVTPWDAEPGSSMANATVTTIADAKVDSVGGHALSLTLPTGDVHIFVGPYVPITSSAPADRTALVAGAHVIVFAVKHDDGSLTIRAVNVGQNGLTPPM
jgi:hypothetical protein